MISKLDRRSPSPVLDRYGLERYGLDRYGLERHGPAPLSPLARLAACVCGLALSGGAVPALAGVSGLCPDGSAFVVAHEADAPCDAPKFVKPSDLPPLRPQLLPRPYIQQLDRDLRDENNPYNLVDKAEALRALRTANTPEAREAAATRAAAVSGSTAAAPGKGAGKTGNALAASGGSGISASAAPRPEIAPAPVRWQDSELRDLTRLVALRQQLAPATLAVDDARGYAQLTLRFAHSGSTESRLRDALGAGAGRVLVFSALADQATDFYPNFLVAQGGATFRPDPADARQSGLLLGTAGPLPQGQLLLGYLVIPERFDLAAPLRIWWNDRELETTLAPAGK